MWASLANPNIAGNVDVDFEFCYGALDGFGSLYFLEKVEEDGAVLRNGAMNVPRWTCPTPGPVREQFVSFVEIYRRGRVPGP